MLESIEIRTSAPVRGSVRPPGSKSITNRALVCAALADGASTLTGALDSEDTRVMVEALQGLGVACKFDAAAATIVVEGCGGRVPSTSGEVYVANSGTTVRFLTAMLAVGHGTWRLHGTPRMHERPIADLVDALGALGADVVSELGTGCAPVVVRGRGLAGGRATVRGNISSQYLSALLMAAPYARRPVELVVDGALVSQPYVQMTLAVMRSFGVNVVASEPLDRFLIPAGAGYSGRTYAIEPDASAASYFFAAAAITGGEVTVEGLSRASLQGDVAFVDVLERMGCSVSARRDAITVVGRPLHGVAVDMNAISDTVQTLAAVALFADSPTTIAGVEHIRHKESDRIGDLAAELRKLGARVDEHPDGLTITPQALRGARIETYKDHRMAMSLALVGLAVPNVVICDPQCTGKTYPRFFADLDRLVHA